jgi:hypothetical protein
MTTWLAVRGTKSITCEVIEQRPGHDDITIIISEQLVGPTAE